MEKREIDTLKLFMTRKTPYDFQCGVYNTILIDSLMGLVDQTLKGRKMEKSFIRKYEISEDNMPHLIELSNRNLENKEYLLLILECFKIIKDQSIN